MKKPIKAARKIVVNGKEYYWFRGRRDIVIWTEEGKKYMASESAITGMDNNSIDRAKRKKYFSITPKQVAEWIKRKEVTA